MTVHMPGKPYEGSDLSGVRAEIRVIDVAAAELLLGTRANRKIARGRVERIAEQMDDDLWLFNGEPIILNERGELTDGQHRLTGVVKTGIPIVCLVVTGVPDDSFHTLNTGAARRLSDVLLINGEHYTPTLAASIRAVIGYRTTFAIGLANTSWQTQRDSVPVGQALQFLEAEPGIRDVAEFIEGSRSISKAPTRSGAHGPAIVLHETADGFPGEAEAFFRMAASGVDDTGQGLPGDHPALLYRNVLLGWATSNHTTHAPMRVGVTVKAWNAFIEGRTMKSLSWRRGGSKAEPFPKIIKTAEELG